MAGPRIQKVFNVGQEFGYDSINIFEALLVLERSVRMNIKRNVFLKVFSRRKCIKRKEAMGTGYVE